MKKLLAAMLISLLALGAFVPAAAVPASGANLMDTMSKAEKDKLNGFFDEIIRVADVGVGPLYTVHSFISDETLIDYAFARNMEPNWDTAKGTASVANIEEDLKRYFGVEEVNHREVEYYDGRQYITGIGGIGWSLNEWSTVTAFFDNGGGTFAATVETWEYFLLDGTTKKLSTDTVVLAPYGADSWQIRAVNGWTIPKALFAGSAPALSVTLNGVQVVTDAAPYIDANGRTMAPVRFISEALGAGVEWNNDSRTVTVRGNGAVITLVIGSSAITVNGRTTAMDTAAVITGGRTFVPVRFIAEALGLSAAWDGETNSVYIDGAPIAPAPASTSGLPASLTAGSAVTWGSYAGQPLEWLVLETQDGKALLITQDIIDLRAYNERAYNEEDRDITWENCTLRQWLNNDFYNTFTDAQKRAITETAVLNEDNSRYETPGGNDTRDKVFLLSIDEAERYFSDDSARTATAQLNLTQAQMEDAARRMDENPHYGDDVTYDGALANITGWTNDNWVWWLRSPGDDADYAAGVDDDGGPVLIDYEGEPVVIDYGGVRPALWVNL
ncbi:MAG: copper amine oxidase N-terminal domain-containing protein [Oscillospiraceae bacterium]|jgi:hypothetical protein|nr:copper amine oxidase N-terminal domain-containing protein [Oscillospiraceae bacterium]